MLEQKTTILFAIAGIVTVVGTICGIAPGVLLTAYPQLGLIAGLLLLIVIFLFIAALLFQYQDSNATQSAGTTYDRVFHRRFDRRGQIMLVFVGFLVFATGTLLGVLCELLLKAVQATLAAQIVIGAMFLLIISVCLIILLVLGVRYSKRSIIEQNQSLPVVFQPNPPPTEAPQNTAAGLNRDRSFHQNDKAKNDYGKSSWADSTFISSTKPNPTSRPTSSIQREYQRLVQPSARFTVNEKVYVNDRDLAQIIQADGLGNYRIQYLADGRFDSKNGTALRKALPLIT